MKRQTDNRRFVLLVVTILVFTASLMFIMSRLINETRDNKSKIIEIVYWSAAQTEHELWRFLDTLDRYGLNDSSVTLDDVLLRLDILWSRINIYESGEIGKQLKSLTKNTDAIESLKEVLKAIEPDLLNLKPGDTVRYKSIRERVESTALPLYRLSQHVNLSEQSQEADFRAETMHTYWTLSFLFVCTFLAGAIMIFSLIRETTRANRSLIAANSAENALREAHVRLEERVLERTEELSREITERKRTEQELENQISEIKLATMAIERQSEELSDLATELTEARDQERKANRSKSEFLAAMSHELRTPLNAIIGFSEMITHELFGPLNNKKYSEYVNDIHHSGSHLLSLINDILDISKIESGQEELLEVEIDVADAVQSAVRLVIVRAEKHGVMLNVDVPDNPAPLYADERKLKQILVNLLTNSIKFTEDGGEIELKVQSCWDLGYRFRVTDTGIGISSEDIPKALSQFGQVDSALNRKYEGTGLGLPLTKSLAELHGGSLALESELGVGTCITVTFPPERIVMDEVNRGQCKAS